MQPAHTIRLSSSMLKVVLSSNIVERAKAVLGPGNMIIDISTCALFVRGCPRTAQLMQRELNLPDPLIARVEALFICHMCSNSTEGIMLSLCEHVVCFRCFNGRIWHMLADPRGKHFPIRCIREGCGEPIALSDIRKLVSAQRLRALFYASVTEHVMSSLGKYRFCPTPKCKTVYLASKVPSIFTCTTCLAQTCTYKNCGRKPHIGWSCRKNTVSLVFASG